VKNTEVDQPQYHRLDTTKRNHQFWVKLNQILIIVDSNKNQQIEIIEIHHSIHNSRLLRLNLLTMLQKYQNQQKSKILYLLCQEIKGS